MLELFRRNIFINSLLLLPYIFFVRIGTLLMPQSYNTEFIQGSIVYSAVYVYLDNPLVQNIIAGFLIFIQALIVNYIFLNQKISRESTQFAGVFYVLFVSLIADSAGLTPILIANTFLLAGLLNILNSYKNTNATAQIFNAGFLIAIAALIYIPYTVFVLFGIVSLLQLRSFKLIEKIQFLVGIITPAFLIFTVKYWFDQPFIEAAFLKDIFFRWPEISLDQRIIEYVAIGIIVFIALIWVLLMGYIEDKKNIHARKKIRIIYVFMVFCLFAYLVFNTRLEEHILSLAIPNALLTGIIASESKNKLFFELLHFVLIIMIFIGQFNLIPF